MDDGGLMVCLMGSGIWTLRGNGDEAGGWELPGFKGGEGIRRAARHAPLAPRACFHASPNCCQLPMASSSCSVAPHAPQWLARLSRHGRGLGQSQLELIRRAAPKGKNKGGTVRDTAEARGGGVKEALRQVA